MATLTNDVWAVSEDDFPRGAALDTQLGFLVRYAILAPSTRNSQPWAFRIEGNRVHLIADLGRGQALADPDKRELYISLGCALENLLVAAEHFGLRHAVAYFPERRQGQHAATITFEVDGTPSPARAGASVHAIHRRRNDNSVFRPVPVPEHLRARLMACCVEDDLRVILTDDHHFHRWIDALTIEADRSEFADPSYRRELASWIGQGVFGEPRMLARLERLAVTRLDLGESVARQDHAIIESAPLLGVICASGDGHLAHLKSGQLFERIWLTATDLGLSVHPMSQTMRHAELRAAVAELIPYPSWMPQHVFRVGFSSRHDEHHTPRRPLADVLL